jgi:hypothetical protein
LLGRYLSEERVGKEEGREEGKRKNYMFKENCLNLENFK